MAKPLTAIATVVVGLFLHACSGTAPTPGGDCDGICRQVAVVCGGNTGQIGAAAGGCQGVCAAVPGGPVALAPCTTAATSCELAQACFAGAMGGDGGLIFPDVGGGDGSVLPDVGPPPVDGPGCGGEKVVGSTQVVPNVHLVLDQSGSMSMEDFGANSEQRLAVLKRVAKGVVGNPDLDGKIRWGLTTFPKGADDVAAQNCILGCDPFDFQAFKQCAADCDAMYGGCMIPTDGPDVEPAADTVGQVQSGIDGMSPAGGTPSAETLMAVKAYLPTFTSSDHPTYVLFGTDGEPTCSDDENGSNTIAAAQALADAGIKVFVVGISSSVAGSDILNQVAVAGGAPRNDNPRFYPAENEQQLTQALGEITTGLASCTFRLDTPAPNPLEVNVYLGNASLPRNDPNGFTYSFDKVTQSASISINGSACQTFQTSGAAVQVRFGCRVEG